MNYIKTKLLGSFFDKVVMGDKEYIIIESKNKEDIVLIENIQMEKLELHLKVTINIYTLYLFLNSIVLIRVIFQKHEGVSDSFKLFVVGICLVANIFCSINIMKNNKLKKYYKRRFCKG